MGDVAETHIYLDRLRTAFNDAVVVIDALDSLNKIAFACKGDMLNLDDGALKRRIGQLELTHPVMLSLTAQSLLLARRAAALPDELHSSDFA